MYDTSDLTSLFAVGFLLGVVVGAGMLLGILVRAGKPRGQK